MPTKRSYRNAVEVNAWGITVNTRLTQRFVGDKDVPMAVANDLYVDWPADGLRRVQ